MTITAQLIDALPPTSNYSKPVFRIVESQEQSATMGLVDTIEEQDLLERLLDDIKPAYEAHTSDRHYLIATPFRYPPLEYGSRFGTIRMPSYFYASETVETMLYECAFYRFVFLDDMESPYNSPIHSEHMSFSVKTKTTNAIDLTTILDSELTELLTDKTSYSLCQQLGQYLVEETSVDTIRFKSARHKTGINVAIGHSEVIISEAPELQNKWIIQTETNRISMRSQELGIFAFELDTFLVAGRLPRPA